MTTFLPFNENIYIGYNENEIINLVNDQRNNDNNNVDYDILEMCFTVYVFTLCSLTIAYIYLFFIL